MSTNTRDAVDGPGVEGDAHDTSIEIERGAPIPEAERLGPEQSRTSAGDAPLSSLVDFAVISKAVREEESELREGRAAALEMLR